MQHTAKMQRWIRAEQLHPEEWVTVQEAARILGISEHSVRKNFGVLEALHVGHAVLTRQRWVVKLAKVEWLKKVRAGEVKAVKPPEVEAWPNEIDAELWTPVDAGAPPPKLTGTEYLRRVWV